MKKSFLVLLIIMSLSGFIITGCSTSSSVTTSTSTTATETTIATETTPEKTIEITFANWTPTQMPPPVEWEPIDFANMAWMNTIEEETHGRVKFVYYPAETLVKSTDMWEAVKVGGCDIGSVAPLFFSGQFPLTEVLTLPGLFENATQAAMVRQTLIDKGYLADEWKDVKVLWVDATGCSDITCKTKQIRTLEDFKGLKIGVQGDPERSVFSAAGAVPVTLPPTEHYIAMERGTLDACSQDINGQVAFKLYEVSPYVTQFPRNTTRCIVQVMNLNKYNSLPSDIREIIDRNSGILWATIEGRRFDLNYSRCFAYLDEINNQKGLPTVYTPPADELDRWFKVAVQPVIEATFAEVEAKGLPATKTYQRALELVELYKTWGF